MRFVLDRPWIAVAAYMALIFALSSFPSLPQPPVKGIDKPEHYLEYGGLAVVALWAIRRSRPRWNALSAALLAIAVAAAYGITDEFHQRFVPNRCCDAVDWMVDVLGATTGVVLASVVIYFRRRRGEWKLKKKRVLK